MKLKRKPISVTDPDVIEIIDNCKNYIFKPVSNYQIDMKTQGEVAERCILWCFNNDILVKN